MKIGILGTGMVGKAHAARLVELGYQVVIGTSDVAKTMASTESDNAGNLPFSEWLKDREAIKIRTFAEAAEFGEIIINALAGHVAVEVLKGLKDEIGDKILIDISNPLDFSMGMPPSLFISNTDSLGEQIQKTLPMAKIVKSFNTISALVQVNPKSLADGDHHIFVSGNDTNAKLKVKELLNTYGWKNIIDLGDITTSRGTEMYLPLWLRLWGSLNNTMFNIKIIER